MLWPKLCTTVQTSNSKLFISHVQFFSLKIISSENCENVTLTDLAVGVSFMFENCKGYNLSHKVEPFQK